MAPNNSLHEESVFWEVEGIKVHASLTYPAGEGPFPAVVFVAGSGPTDRNWNTPIIPGTNGSGALMAQALTERGFMTLRYDKRASGPHMAENFQHMLGKISMQGHMAELAGGVNLLASSGRVNPAKIFVFTNSEGCVHALNYQAQPENLPFAGMVLTSPFARAAGELAHSQIAAQLAAVPGGDAMLSAYDFALQEFIAGRTVPVDESLPEGLRQVIQAITQPANQPFSRELWIYNPAASLAAVNVPVLIVIGKKDIQVDWQIDGPIFESIAQKHHFIRVVYPENANHVMKYEPKPRLEVTPADAMTTYSADDVMLDPEPVEIITEWLRAQL